MNSIGFSLSWIAFFILSSGSQTIIDLKHGQLPDDEKVFVNHAVQSIKHGYQNDSVLYKVYNYPGFVLDQSEEGDVYELVCFNHNSEVIPEAYLATRKEEVALCQQYDNIDPMDARFPIRTFMQVALGSWMEVNHSEDDRTILISENPEEAIKIDSIFVSRRDSDIEEVYIYRYLKMTGRE